LYDIHMKRVLLDSGLSRFADRAPRFEILFHSRHPERRPRCRMEPRRIGSCSIEVSLLQQLRKARVAAEGIVGTVDLQIHEPRGAVLNRAIQPLESVI